MQYISTRGNVPPTGFEDVVMTGLARDGGLFLPAHIPDIRALLPDWRKLSYRELTVEIMQLFCDLPRTDLEELVQRAYCGFHPHEVTPLQRLGRLHVLELFHGPTLAFKDLALQLLGGLFEYLLSRQGGRLSIVAATSGDTGSAAIHGVRGRRHIRIFVLYPHGRISPAQERQMITVPDANVFTLALRGNFDDCQHIVKALLNDLPLRDEYALGAVNSINWARILAQIVYYFYGAFRVMEARGSDGVRFAVPTGNFGDIFAGYLAWRMGLPVRRLVLATNENDILARFFRTGVYRAGQVRTTISPSMDIQVASNFERYLYYRLHEDAQALNNLMRQFTRTGEIILPAGTAEDAIFSAGSADTDATLACIRRHYAEHGYLLDPHTAAGVHVAEQHLHPDEPMISLATAHPAKFSDAINSAIGHGPPPHPTLAALASLPERRTVLNADIATVRNYIREHA